MRRFVVGLAMGIATFAPSWAFADDEQIAKAIVEKLEARKKEGQLKGFNIDLKVDKGTVYMAGHVASTEQQQVALDIARRADGVEAVVNDLKVKRDAAPVRKTATKEKESAERPSLLSRWFGGAPTAASDSAKTSKNVIKDSKVQAVAHETAAPATKSAAAVPSNEALIDVLAERLNRHRDDGTLKDFDINLTADRGSVTVSGDVSSAEQRDLILDTIRRTPGVVKVVNSMTMPNQEVAAELPAPTPARIRPAVEAASPVSEEPAPQKAVVIGRLLPQTSRSEVAPAFDHSDAPAGTGVVQTAAPPAVPTPAAPTPIAIPSPPAEVPTPAARPASTSVGGYTAIPVQVVPAPFSPGAMSPLQPAASQRPLAFAPASGGAAPASNMQPIESMPAHMPGPGIGVAPARFDHPNMPGYAWPSYAAHPNYAAVTYPKQYSPSAWPYIGPFYPYPQVPLGWRKVTMKWHDGWWFLDFKDK